MKPSVFIGSSVPGLDVAYAIQEDLERDADVTVWPQGIFEPSQHTLNSLLDAQGRFDFGIFVFTFDDITSFGSASAATVRDNVLLELGIFVGGIGLNRCFIVTPRIQLTTHIPTDLLGLTPVDYDGNRNDNNLAAALGPACNRIRNRIRQLGRLVRGGRETPDVPIWPRVYDSVADAGPDIIAEIQQLAAPGRSDRLLVQVLGYRLRSVRTLLLHVFDKALDGTKRIEKVDFEIFHVDPDYLEQLPRPASIGSQNEAEFRERMRTHATLLRSNLADFSRYSDRSDFRDLGLTCRTVPYCMPPAPCAYVLGSEVAYVGAFNWDDTIGDFAGPRHPCLRVERGQETFSKYIAWCHNRAKLLENWRG